LNQPAQIVGGARHDVAIGDAFLIQPAPRQAKQAGIYVDRGNATRNPGYRQRKQTIAGTEVDYIHAMLDADRSNHGSRIGPQCFPPLGVGHFSAVEKSGKIGAHRGERSVRCLEAVHLRQQDIESLAVARRCGRSWPDRRCDEP